MSAGGSSKPTGVFIWGSCVSRDTFGYLPKDRFALVRYVARQSAISAATPPVTSIEPPQLTSAFQARNVRGDFVSSLLPELSVRADNVDLLLVDLTDERLGVYVLPDGTVVTRSNELIASGAEKDLPKGTHHLAFGTDEHFTCWTQAIIHLGQSIPAAVPRAQVVLLDLPWAARSDSGTQTPPSYGLTAAEGNLRMRRYARAAELALSAKIVTVPEQSVTSSTEHAWGEAPFHYSTNIYVSAATQVHQRLCAD